MHIYSLQESRLSLKGAAFPVKNAAPFILKERSFFKKERRFFQNHLYPLKNKGFRVRLFSGSNREKEPGKPSESDIFTFVLYPKGTHARLFASLHPGLEETGDTSVLPGFAGLESLQHSVGLISYRPDMKDRNDHFVSLSKADGPARKRWSGTYFRPAFRIRTKDQKTPFSSRISQLLPVRIGFSQKKADSFLYYKV